MNKFENPIIIPSGEVSKQYRLLTPEEERDLAPKAETEKPKSSFEQRKQEIIQREREVILAYFGKELGQTIDIPAIPEEITPEQLEFWEQNQLALHYSPGIEIPEDNNFSGQKKKLDPDIYKWIQEGKISPDSIKLPQGWILVDERAKPAYAEAKQMYENDLLSPVLEDLRNKGSLTAKDPAGSRFNISHDDLNKPEVKTALAAALKVKPEQLDLPPATLYNYLGNAFYPEWGDTNIYEWFKEEFQGGSHLLGGKSNLGGLSFVNPNSSDYRDGFLAFRPLARFSS